MFLPKPRGVTSDLTLPGKWTVQAHGRRLVLRKKANEKSSHVVMKALLWALFLPSYPDLMVEVSVGDRSKPDVVCLDSAGVPLFWAEAGQVSVAKVERLCRKFRSTHLVVAKWGVPLDSWVEIARRAVTQSRREGRFELIGFPEGSRERFVDSRGNIALDFKDLARMEIS